MGLDAVVREPGSPPSVDPGARRFAVAWRHATLRRLSAIGHLEHRSDEFIFRYLASAPDIRDFQPLLGFPDFHATYRSPSLFPIFEQRVMDRRRPDYQEYLEALDLPLTCTALDVLSRSGGQRKGDTIQLTEHPTVTASGATEYTFLVRGIRHVATLPDDKAAALASLKRGELLTVLPEPSNPFNPQALLVATREQVPLGWIPDLLLDYVAMAQKSDSFSLCVQRISGPEVPGHARLVARLRGHLPPGYRPFSGSAWQTAEVAVRG